MYQATGAIHKIFDTNQVNARFTKREFVLEVAGGRQQQLVQFEVTGPRECEELDHFVVGEEVSVEFDLRGREYKGKFYTNLVASKVEGIGDKLSRDRKNQQSDGDDIPPPSFDGDDGLDDCPFK